MILLPSALPHCGAVYPQVWPGLLWSFLARKCRAFKHAMMAWGGNRHQNHPFPLVLLHISVNQLKLSKNHMTNLKNLTRSHMSFILFENVTCSMTVFYTSRKKIYHKSFFFILKCKVTYSDSSRTPPSVWRHCFGDHRSRWSSDLFSSRQRIIQD